MTIVGISGTKNANGEMTSTLHVTDEFQSYYNDKESGRSCVGKRTESIYVGHYDISNLKVGMEIEVLYGKAISGRNGTYQPVARIDILGNK